MIIKVSAKAGYGSTRKLLNICCDDLINHKKVIFITNTIDYQEWLGYIDAIVGKENLNYFRPVYAKDLNAAFEVLPYIDKTPYDVIALDRYPLIDGDLTDIAQYLSPNGTIIYTEQLPADSIL